MMSCMRSSPRDSRSSVQQVEQPARRRRRRPARPAAHVGGERAAAPRARRRASRKRCVQAGVDAIPHPGQRLLRGAARRSSPLASQRVAERCDRPPERRRRRRRSARSAAAPRHASASPCCAGVNVRCCNSRSALVICACARVAASASRSALLMTTRSASSITPFLIACRSSPALGSCSSTNMSVMPATAVSLWPTPTVSTITTS